MAETGVATFICPACGEAELPLPENMDPNDIPYVHLSEIHDCDQSKAASYIYGNGHSRGFGGVIRETIEDGGERERWVSGVWKLRDRRLDGNRQRGGRDRDSGHRRQWPIGPQDALGLLHHLFCGSGPDQSCLLEPEPS